MSDKLKTLSPRQLEVYNYLEKHDSSSVLQIAKALNVLPNGIYRELEALEEAGYIRKSSSRPRLYTPRPQNESLDIFLLNCRDWFLKSTISQSESKIRKSATDDQLGIDISLIQSRDDLLRLSTSDTKLATGEICLLVSGLETPAEVVLENKLAVERGVVVNALVQESGLNNAQVLDSWQKTGVRVRKCPSLKTRILLFDKKISYIVSYNPRDNLEGTGVRIVYSPIAQLLHSLFLEKWDNGIEV